MKPVDVFIILSAFIVFISRKVILRPKSHGFYRFFAWELMALLFAFNLPHWFENPTSWNQILSWILLVSCIPFALTGLYEFMKNGKQIKNHKQPELFGFEKTSMVIDSGIYRVIRHPMYASLLMLNWGIFLKNPDLIFTFAALFSSVFLFLTARTDEKECIQNFGKPYLDYMKKTAMFIPFVY
jgi:protein-S-isoprenylcysteine O-methyltransferase Ste14